MNRLLSIAAIAAILAGCASTDVKEQMGAPVEDRKPDPITQAPTQSTPAPVKQVQQVQPPVTSGVGQQDIRGNPLKDPGNILSKRSVFFDYDSTMVRDEFKPLITAHSKYLTDNRGRKVVVQGNTDERGSREYNLALGQRRADSVKRMMMLLGVTDGQIESVSFGEEKPRATGTDEKSFAENRRSDIVYEGE
jgi:peptidoglycan-associated lipoprotein